MTRDALRPGLVALLFVLAGCAGPVVSPGPADGGGGEPPAAATSTPPGSGTAASPTTASPPTALDGPSTAPNGPSTAPNAPPTVPNGPPTAPNATPTVDPTAVLDHEDIFSDVSRQLVADVVAAGGTLTRDGEVEGLGVFYDWPYVNYRGACYEISSHSTVVYVKGFERFILRPANAGAVENDSTVVSYDDLPPMDRRAVDEALPDGQASVFVRKSVRYGSNDTARTIETPSVVTDYRYVEYRGEYYELTHLTRLHADLSEVVSTTVVAERVRDEPCPTGN